MRARGLRLLRLRLLPSLVFCLCCFQAPAACLPLPPRWVPDELSPSAYVRLGELRALPVDSFDQRFDVWVITAQLSEGCGGPDLGEEIIL